MSEIPDALAEVANQCLAMAESPSSELLEKIKRDLERLLRIPPLPFYSPSPQADPPPRAIAKGLCLVLCPFCGAGCLPTEHEDRHRYRCTGCGKTELLPPEAT